MFSFARICPCFKARGVLEARFFHVWGLCGKGGGASSTVCNCKIYFVRILLSGTFQYYTDTLIFCTCSSRCVLTQFILRYKYPSEWGHLFGTKSAGAA